MLMGAAPMPGMHQSQKPGTIATVCVWQWFVPTTGPQFCACSWSAVSCATCKPSRSPSDLQVSALQQYAAQFGRCIVTNAEVFAAVQNAPKHRLVPVDVLSLGTRAHPRRGSFGYPTKGPADVTLSSELVYECVATVEAREDEWMYQLQVCTWAGGGRPADNH